MTNQEEIILNIIKNNSPKYNYSKLCEELFELGEVCSKMINKKSEAAPSKEKLIEELGDVYLRIYIICKQENIIEKVDERINAKLEQLNKYISEGKYKGGL